MVFIKNSTKAISLATVSLLVVACVNSPSYYEYELDDEIIIEEKEIHIETRAASHTDAEIVQTAEQEQVEFIQEEKTYEKFSNASGYWKNALKHLQHGNEDEARWALEQALKLNPKSKISKKLLAQIDADAINELGIEAFEYKVQLGDSLSVLSRKYLNDPLKFYLLAKYNDISNPSHLVIGRTINIPGKKTEEVVEPIIQNNVASSELIKSVIETNDPVVTEENAVENEYLAEVNSADQYYQARNFEKVISILEDSKSVNKYDAKAITLLVSSYYEKSKKHLKIGNIQEAKYILLKASELEPDNPKVNMALIDMDESSQTEIFYEQGMQALADNNTVEAYEYMEKVLNLNPYHKRAMDTKNEIKDKLISIYSRRALLAQRKQQLDAAIEYWDEVLALDNNNDNAKLYRKKAMALKMKLEKFAAK